MAREYSTALTYDLLTCSERPADQLFGSYGRLPATAWKIALILAALDWSTRDAAEPRITAAHWAQAQQIAESWRASAHRALAMLTEDEAAAESAALEDRILAFVQEAGSHGARMRDLYRALHVRRETAELAASALVRDGLIEVSELKNERGRLSLVYRAARKRDDR